MKIPLLCVKDKTYSRFNLLKAKAIVNRDITTGSSFTWDHIASAACDMCEKDFDEFMALLKSKKKGVDKQEDISLEDIKEKLRKGEKVTSEDLEKKEKSERMVG